MPTNECLGAILPFFHTLGISGVFDNLMGGFRFVIIPNFTLRRFLQAVQDHKVFSALFPTSIVYIMSILLILLLYLDLYHNTGTGHSRPISKTASGATLRSEFAESHQVRRFRAQYRDYRRLTAQVEMHRLPRLRYDGSHHKDTRQLQRRQSRGQHWNRHAILRMQSNYLLINYYWNINKLYKFRLGCGPRYQ